MKLNPVRLDALKADGVRHAFFTREGGVSEGVYATLNGGVGSRDALQASGREQGAHGGRARDCARSAARALPSALVPTSSPCRRLGAGESAAMRRARDCDAGPGPRRHRRRLRHGPFRRSVRENNRRGACGVEGRADGVLEATVAAMEKQGRAARQRSSPRSARRSGRDSYEVGPEFFARFLEAAQDYAQFFTPSTRVGAFHVRSAGLYRGAREGRRNRPVRELRRRHICRRSALLFLPPLCASQ